MQRKTTKPANYETGPMGVRRTKSSLNSARSFNG